MNAILMAALSTVVSMVALALYMSFRARSARVSLHEKVQFLETELTSKRTELATRQEEARATLLEAKSRETAATARALESEKRLQTALEERGTLTAQIGRLDEIKTHLADREARLQGANDRITVLEKAKTAAEGVALSASQRAQSSIEKERETTVKVVAAKDEQIQQLQTFISSAKETLGTEFKALSSKLLKDASDELVKTTNLHTEHHKEQVSGMLKPVKETMDRLDQHVTESNQARLKAETLLDDQVKRLAGATEVLTSALKKPVVRGSWGETQLENALENAGLEAEIDYILQHSTDAEDGIKRTDAVINLPKGRRLVVDSKNLMESYFAWAAATDPDKKAELAEVHAKSLKNHIKALSGKEYWRRYEGLDCVILFIPHDGMYHAAIADESDLIREASDRRVFIANPMSLIPLLKAVKYVMNQDRLNKSAAEISALGTELYGEIARFAENFAVIGNRLKGTVNAYNNALPGLDRFIVSKSRRLKQLGANKGNEPAMPNSLELSVRSLESDELASRLSEDLVERRLDADVGFSGAMGSGVR